MHEESLHVPLHERDLAVAVHGYREARTRGRACAGPAYDAYDAGHNARAAARATLKADALHAGARRAP
jgi:hypothetical protein